jgi:hypothetical protein
MGTEREDTSIQDEDRGMFEAALRDAMPEGEPASASELVPEGADEGGEGTDNAAERVEGEGGGEGEDAVSKESTENEARKGRSPRVPLARLQQETDKRRDAETENANLRERNASLEQRLTSLERRFEPGAEPGSQSGPPETPDPLMDPEGYADFVRGSIRQEMVRDKVASSFEDAHEAHGQNFEAAFNLLSRITQGGDPRDRDRIVAAPNPGKALMKWFSQREMLREAGDDPAAYRARIAGEAREALKKDPEFRKSLLAELRDEAGSQTGRPYTTTRLPSLSGASGGSRESNRFPESDAELFHDALPRRR